MRTMNCKHECWRDRDTGDIHCPVVGGWVENCPKTEYEGGESENGGDRDDD